MTSAKTVELTVRVAMLIKAASELVGARESVPILHAQLREVQRQTLEIQKFLNTAENDK